VSHIFTVARELIPISIWLAMLLLIRSCSARRCSCSAPALLAKAGEVQRLQNDSTSPVPLAGRIFEHLCLLVLRQGSESEAAEWIKKQNKKILFFGDVSARTEKLHVGIDKKRWRSLWNSRSKVLCGEPQRVAWKTTTESVNCCLHWAENADTVKTHRPINDKRVAHVHTKEQ
jgi:hypothetical protein